MYITFIILYIVSARASFIMVDLTEQKKNLNFNGKHKFVYLYFKNKTVEQETLSLR